MNLVLERNDGQFSDAEIGIAGPAMLTPALSNKGRYWKYRVVLGHGQAIIGFEKFSTIGIGFMHEEDWNTNLPFDVPVQRIFDHIKHNKGIDLISDEDCIKAITMIRDAIFNDKPKGVPYIDVDGKRKVFE